MKYLILNILSWPIILIMNFMRPFGYPFRRIFHTACLKAAIKDMDLSVQFDGHIYVTGTRDIKIGKRCRLGRDTELRTMEAGHIHLGNDVRINRSCTITSYTDVYIDDFSIIGEFVSIRDANHGMSKEEPMRYQKHTSKPIRIGRDVWIGRGSCVLAGVTIGDGSVIGANSVVSKDIPSFSIAAGAPAKVIKKRE